MKPGHQSLIREVFFVPYLREVRRVVRLIKRTDTEIDVRDILRVGGFGTQQTYLDYLEMREVADNVARASREGYGLPDWLFHRFGSVRSHLENCSRHECKLFAHHTP